ncbi:SRPBCC family protein [Streptomyces sp. DH10]|uniref:SRPBCC family protein n=1 Tax=Streptomyces sp. DH10 TaxID=3040121 RepID=UPI0030147398
MITVLNVHERELPAAPAAVGALIDSLGTGNDRLWPPGWPPVRFDRPLAVGASGGHGCVRYEVSHYVPGEWVRFRVTGPRGLRGFHEFSVQHLGAERTVLRNTLVLRPGGVRWFGWLLYFRPLYDAAFRQSLDCAERALTGTVARPADWGWYVRLLRAATARVAAEPAE